MISAEEQEQSCDAPFSLASCCTTAAIPEPWEQLPALLLLPATPRFHFHPGPGRACPCWTSRTLCSGLASTGQAAGEPAGPHQRSSSEDRSRYVFFFCSLHNFFFQEDLSTPPFTPRLSSGHCGQSAGRRASHPRQPFTHGLGSRIHLSCTQHCSLVFGRAEPSLHTLHGCHQPHCRS